MKKKELIQWLSDRELCSTGDMPLLKWRKQQHEAGHLVKKVLKKRKHEEAFPPLETRLQQLNIQQQGQMYVTRAPEAGDFTHVPSDVIWELILPYMEPVDLIPLLETCKAFYFVVYEYLRRLGRAQYGPEQGTPMAVLLESHLRGLTPQKRHAFMMTESAVEPRPLILDFIGKYGYADVFPYVRTRAVHRKEIEAAEADFVRTQYQDRIDLLNREMRRKGYHKLYFVLLDGKLVMNDIRDPSHMSSFMRAFPLNFQGWNDGWRGYGLEAELQKFLDMKPTPLPARLLKYVPLNMEAFYLLWLDYFNAHIDRDRTQFAAVCANSYFYLKRNAFRSFLQECHRWKNMLNKITPTAVLFFWSPDRNSVSLVCVDIPLGQFFHPYDTGFILPFIDKLCTFIESPFSLNEHPNPGRGTSLPGDYLVWHFIKR